MSITRRLLALGIASVVLAGCSSATQPAVEQPTTDTTTPTTDTMTPQVAAPVTVQLAAQNKSGQTGTATFEDLGGGKTKVTLALTGGTFTAAQPAHIHTGTCAKPGAVKYPLTDVVGGMSETTVDAPMSSLWNGDLLVNVHKSAAQSTVYTACGEMKAPAADTMIQGSAAPAPADQNLQY
ncbi:MAG: CHRD domain-containing protein [Candidatus Woesebacteria bacterium]